MRGRSSILCAYRVANILPQTVTLYLDQVPKVGAADGSWQLEIKEILLTFLPAQIAGELFVSVPVFNGNREIATTEAAGRLAGA